MWKEIEFGHRRCLVWNERNEKNPTGRKDVLIQLVDEHERDSLEQEIQKIRELADPTGDQRIISMIAVPVSDWNSELSPWKVPAVFGDEDFGEGAAETFRFLAEELIPEFEQACPDRQEDSKTVETKEDSGCMESGVCLQSLERRDSCEYLEHRGYQEARSHAEDRGHQEARGHTECRFWLGGYSLSGLFALWAAYQTDIFSGIAAVSPSVWFPGWKEYMEDHEIRTRKVYLSLGDKEEKTRNKVMCQVGDNIRRLRELLTESSCCQECTLEWNPGNHFKEPQMRMAKGFAWLLGRQQGRKQNEKEH